MRITREPMRAWAHCPRRSAPGVPCEGERQEEVAGIRETVAFTYSDGWGARMSSDPADAVLASITERTVEHVRWADPADAPCPHCGHDREVTDQVRPTYDRLTTVPPDQLLRIPARHDAGGRQDRRRRRAPGQRAGARE